MWTEGYTVGHTVTHYSFHNEINPPPHFGRVVARVEGRYTGGEDEWIGKHDAKFTKNQ